MSQMIPEYGGCPWPMDPACKTESWEAHPPEVQARSLALASSTLRRLTGYRVGNCPITVRPCTPANASEYLPSYRDLYGSFGSSSYYGSFSPGMDLNGSWINSCGCNSSCGCSTTCEIKLPGPVGRIDEVKVDGNIVSASNYRVDNGNVLTWTGGGDCPWPASQDLALADTEAGTFSITYLNAHQVDLNGAFAVGLLAIEYAKACTGGKCRLPAGVTQVVRQGISMDISSGAFPGGLTGIREVDSYVALWNPHGQRQPSTVWSPYTQNDRHFRRV